MENASIRLLPFSYLINAARYNATTTGMCIASECDAGMAANLLRARLCAHSRSRAEWDSSVHRHPQHWI